MEPLVYNYSVAVTDCAKTGLIFDPNMAVLADPVFAGANLSQAQVDAVLHLHCKIMATAFDRTKFKFWQRVIIAAHFLGLGKGIVSDAI